MNVQTGPDPGPLAEVVAAVTYKPGWDIRLEVIDRPTEHHAGSHGLTLIVIAIVQNSLRDEPKRVEHWFPVPTATYGRHTWERWILDQLIQVETHEAMEFYTVDGYAPFFPAHRQGRNPYEIRRADSV